MSRKFFILLMLGNLLTGTLQAQLLRYQDLNEQPPVFTFEDEHQKPYTLNDFKGKVVLINLWAPFCGPCIQELPSFQRLSQIFTPEEIVILPICTSLQYKEQARSAFLLGGLDNLKLYFDPSNTLMKTFKARGIPVTLVINKEGKLIGRLDGATEWDHFENIQLISDILKGNSSKPLRWYEKILKFLKG